MADTLESLELEVVHSATGAADSIKSVTSAIRSLGKALDNVLPKLHVLKQEMGDNTINFNQSNIFGNTFNNVRQAAEGAKKATSQAASGVRSLAKEASKSKAPLEQFIGSLKRIAMYRLLRTIIKAITQAFKEGLEWAYTFSSGVDGEGHRFAEAMNSIKAAGTQMKAQLGAAFIGLLAAIEPILIKLINLVTAAANAISQLFAAFTGGTYLKSTKQLADNMNSAASGGKELKNQLLGFDEINRLNDNSGGGGAGGIDPNSLYEVAEVEGIFAKIAAKWKELKGSLDFTKLQESWDRLKESASGLAETIGKGLGWAWDNILVPLAHWTIEELAPALVDALATAFDFLKAVLEALAPILEPLWENVLKPFFEWCGNLIVDGLKELTDLLKDLTDLINGDITWQEFIDGLNGVQIALLALGGLAVLTAIGKLTTAVAGIPVSIGKAIPQMAANLGKMAKVAATGALAVFDGVMIAYDVVKLKEAADTYHEAQLAHNNEMDTALSAYKKLYEEKGKEAADAWAKMAYDIDTTNMEFDEAQAAIANKIEQYWDGVPQNMWDGFKQGWDYYFGEDGKGLWQLFKDAFNNVIQWLKDLLGIHSPSTVFEDIGTNIVQGLMDGFKAKWDEFFLNIQTWWSGLSTWWSGLSLKTIVGQVTGGTSINTNGLSNSADKFATGGFPDSGEMFIAREAGPELVGTIGGRTAVANNDQIVEAVSMGVFDAVSSAMGGRSDNMSVHVYLDSREIKAGQMRLARAAGV